MNIYAARIMAVAILALAGGPTHASDKDTQKPELKTDAESGKHFTSWVASELATVAGVRLKFTKFGKHYGGIGYDHIEVCGAAIPLMVADGSSSSFCYASIHDGLDLKGYDTGFYFQYDILVPDGKDGWRASGYWLDGATMVPTLGERKIDCLIKASGSQVAAADAPFGCATSWTGSGPQSSPHWKITSKKVQVIDIDTASPDEVTRGADLIASYCTVIDTPSCLWTRTQKSSAFLADRDDWQSLTNWADSCPPTDPNRPTVLSSSRTVQISWSDKVGGKIFGKVSGDVLVVKVEAGLEVSYEHSITQSDSYGEGYQYTIPYNYKSALYLQHGMLEVSGDFSITTESERFLIKNAVFSFPLQKDVVIEGRGQPVQRGVVVHMDIPCSQQTPVSGEAPPANAKLGAASKGL